MEDAIIIKDLHISYRTVQAASIFKALFKKEKKVKKFDAIKGISLTIKKGQIVGLIGKNGSGKSTLLRAVANIFKADAGTIDTCGNTVQLMSIGVGFQNDLSGRENIYLSGMLLGYTKEYINEQLDNIIEFSELGDFIDQPVRTYSSGMYSKLAFSITSTLESDIILVDEVLSVGDVNFRKKSYARLKEMINQEDKTVLIVSHNSNTIRELCSHAVWLNDGILKMTGEVNEVVDAYEDFMSKETEKKRLQKEAAKKK
ncbi:MAG TPA: ABC transporter ATP-binding protein [Clostridiales bacterium]|jgi:ABC-type polysaccharide/polyol phosphate transport system ATPase subunit|nr:ABC transporter ATP-binding protein [Clostridiales bacterium]